MWVLETGANDIASFSGAFSGVKNFLGRFLGRKIFWGGKQGGKFSGADPESFSPENGVNNFYMSW